MLVAAAVCPHPPLLIPEATGLAADDGLGELRAACAAAVDALLAAEPGLLVLVGGAGRTERFPPSAVGSLQQYGIPVVIGAGQHRAGGTTPQDPPGQHRPGGTTPPDPAGQHRAGGTTPPDPPGQPVLPESLTIGSWLVSNSFATAVPEVSYQAVSRSLRPAGCLALGARLAAAADRVGMLVLGDATAIRATGVPGAVHQAADCYDSRVAAALAAADTRALAALPPDLDDELLVAGRAAWQVLAGAVAGQPFSASLRYRAAPLGVCYLVASLASGSRPPVSTR